jgi:hypothetical protein
LLISFEAKNFRFIESEGKRAAYVCDVGEIEGIGKGSEHGS